MLGKKTGGRKPGSKNVSTRLREQKLAEALIAERLTAEQAASLTSLPALRHILRTELLAGDYASAKVTANMIAPYENARLQSTDLTVHNELANVPTAELDLQAEQMLAELAAKRTAAKLVN